MNMNMTLLAQALMFAALIWFVVAFIWPPLLTAIEARQKKIAEGLAEAESAKQALSAAQSKEAEVIKEARAKAAEIIDRAHHQANQMVDDAKVAAIAERERQLKVTGDEVEHLMARARDTLRGSVASLVVAGAEQLIKKEIDPATHQRLLDDLITQI